MGSEMCIRDRIQSHQPDIVVIQFGMNDCNHWNTDQGLPRVSIEAFSANLSEIITRVIHFGAKKVFLNTNHPTLLNKLTFPKTQITYQESNSSYNEAIRLIARKSGVELNDVEFEFLKAIRENKNSLDELLLADDLLHLSKKGHDLYYSFIYPKIEQAVSEILPKCI